MAEGGAGTGCPWKGGVRPPLAQLCRPLSSQPLTPIITALSSCPCSALLHASASCTRAIPRLLSRVFPCGQLLLIPTHPLTASSDISSGMPFLTSLAPACLLPLLCQHIHHIVTAFYVSGLSDFLYSSMSWQSPSILPAIQWMRKWSTCCV